MSTLKFNKWKTKDDVALSPVIQTLYATSGFVNQTIVSTTPVLLSGMSVTITPRFTSSKIAIYGMVTASWTYVASLHIYRNNAELIASHGGNNQSGGDTALFTHYQSSQESSRPNQVFPFPVLYVDSPNSTSATTYDFRANSGWSGGTETFYFNNRNSSDMLSSSWMIVQEIAQ
jgi:hypothetical protein